MYEGFSLHHNVFSRQECAGLIERLNAVSLHRSRAGIRHLLPDSCVANLARDERVLSIARQVLRSESAVPFRATLFEKTPRANWLVMWHQDTALPFSRPFRAPGWESWSEKAGVHYVHAPAWALEQVVALRLHLDDSHEDNGPLRVLPNTHTRGVLEDEAVSRLARETPNVSCLVDAGGVLAMRPLLLHASSKSVSDAPRRVLHIEYAPSLQLGENIRLALA